MRNRGSADRLSPAAPRSRAAVRILCAMILCGICLLLWIWLSGRETPPATLGELIGQIGRGEPGAVARAKSAAAKSWSESLPLLQGMVRSANWRLRAAACEILGEREDPNLAHVLVPRCSDSDWRVRAAAFAALGRLTPLRDPALLRDVPLDDRERVLLHWLDAHDDRMRSALAAELCELYAEPGHVEIGRPLAQRCLSCHAGAPPTPFAATDACVSCHRRIHAQWAVSAHGQSLSHLQLKTIDPATREAKWMDFGQVRGITCTECHRPPSPDTGPASAATRPQGCPFAFRPVTSPMESCLRCHAATYRQWLAWRKGVQPRRATWPPGHLDLRYRGDTRGCVDCHMRRLRRPDGPGPRDHRWAARRDVDLLREGIDIQVRRPRGDGQGQKVRLVLTNLSGHAYPAGSRRRALLVYAGAGAGGEPPLIATLAPRRPGLLHVAAAGNQQGANTQPALAPGEQRSFDVSVAASAEAVAWRVVYCRNLLQPGSYSVEILSGTERLGG